MRLKYLLLQLLEEAVTFEVQLVSGLRPLVRLKHLKHVVPGESGPFLEHHVGRVIMISLSLLCHLFQYNINMARDRNFTV